MNEHEANRTPGLENTAKIIVNSVVFNSSRDRTNLDKFCEKVSLRIR